VYQSTASKALSDVRSDFFSVTSFSAYTTESEFSSFTSGQFEIIFLKEANRFQIPWAKFSFDCSQFHFFKSKLNHSRNYFLHNFHLRDFPEAAHSRFPPSLSSLEIFQRQIDPRNLRSALRHYPKYRFVLRNAVYDFAMKLSASSSVFAFSRSDIY